MTQLSLITRIFCELLLYPSPSDWRLIAELLRGDAERFDAFANLPHYPFPGGRTLRVPFTAMGAAYYSLRDRLGV